MRLLVTRPEPDATRTAERLRRLGHSVIVQPLLTIVFAPPPADLPSPAAILVTSQNALRALAGWPQSVAWHAVPLFAAGPATAGAATALGFSDVRAGTGDAGTLADTVRAELPPDAGPLLYPAARDRVGDLAEALAAHAYDVRTVEAYRADRATGLDAPVREALADGALDGVLLYSRRTARAFHDLAVAAGLSDRIAGLTGYVISEPVAAVLAVLTDRIRVAPQPNEDSLLGLIPPAS